MAGPETLLNDPPLPSGIMKTVVMSVHIDRPYRSKHHHDRRTTPDGYEGDVNRRGDVTPAPQICQQLTLPNGVGAPRRSSVRPV